MQGVNLQANVIALSEIITQKDFAFSKIMRNLVGNYIKNMEVTALSPTQMHLLKLFAFNNSEEYAREIQSVLTQHFQNKLAEEADHLWEEGVLNQEVLDEIRQTDLHAK